MMPQKQFAAAFSAAAAHVTTADDLVFAIVSLPGGDGPEVLHKGGLTTLAGILRAAAVSNADLGLALIMTVNALPGLQVVVSETGEPLAIPTL